MGVWRVSNVVHEGFKDEDGGVGSSSGEQDFPPIAAEMGIITE